MSEDKDFKEFPKMLYTRIEGNEIKSMVVNSKEEQREAGSEWKETPPKKRGRPAAKAENEA